MQANRVGYGHNAWSKRIRSHRAQDNAGGAASAGLDKGNLAGFLNADEVAVAKSRYQLGAGKQQVLSNEVLCFMAAGGLNHDDPSNIKRFFQYINGAPYRVYRRELNEKLHEIVVEHYEKTVMTSLLGIRKLTVS
eukprot:Seg16663.1 transcript_id=Seg16663.1/GoldUCD/mRNA.D3Y31 product="hypothetical protein" protein_id=Seg16663.1/GoldUCD/D3Y31